MIRKARVFSDSHSAVGQLTLGWEASAQRSTVKEVKAEMAKLEESGVLLHISWTARHVDINGNEHTDRLAKEAASEAKEREDLPQVIALGDVKEAATEFGCVKWQEMWEKIREEKTSVSV